MADVEKVKNKECLDIVMAQILYLDVSDAFVFTMFDTKVPPP